MTDSEKPEEPQASDDTQVVPEPDSKPYWESEWSPAYAETQVGQTPTAAPADTPPADTPSADGPDAFAATTVQPQPGIPYTAVGQQFTSDPFGQGVAPVQPPYSATPPPVPQPAMPPPATWYPAPPQMYPGAPMGYAGGYGGYAQNLGPAPQTSQVSAILATVFGGMMLVSIYFTLAGIAPLVLGIVALSKANSVSKLWAMGQQDPAYAAAESSKKLAMWAWASMAIGVVVEILVVVVVIVALAAG